MNEVQRINISSPKPEPSVRYHETTQTSTNQAIKTEGLTIRYSGKTALSNISLSMERGRITGIIGPNGAGKSTLIKGIMKLVHVDSGTVLVNGHNVEKERKNIAYVEQRSELDLSFPINVFDTVLLGTYPKLRPILRPGRREKEKAAAALETVKMSDYSKRQIGALSGGQLQRVFIARALAQEADIFLLDEPFVGIDMVSEELIMDILFTLRDAGKTIAIVHHDLHKVEDYFDNIIILNKQLVASGSVQEAFNMDTIRQAYGDTLGPVFARKEVGES